MVDAWTRGEKYTPTLTPPTSTLAIHDPNV
jgi:hypothetical protein